MLSGVAYTEQTIRYWRLVLLGFEGVHADYEHQGDDHTGGPEYRLLSFFIFANHLRDYLIEAEGHDREAVNEFVRSHLALARCADLADASKHCHRSRKGYADIGPETPSLGGRSGTFHVVSEGDSVRMEIDSYSGYRWTLPDGTELDSYALARDVVRAWHAYPLGIADWWKEAHGI